MATSTPNWNSFLESVWGWPDEWFGGIASIAGASNVVIGNNPPYTIQDFLAFYPKWGGTPANLQATTTTGSAVLTGTSSTQGIAVGNPVAGPGIPDGTFITAVSTNNVTLSNNATASASPIVVTVWNAPLVPFTVILSYIYLASASLVQARWNEMWAFAMALFVAHFLTLYAQADGNPNSTVGQAAAQGASTGVTVAKSVGDVSVSYQPFEALSNWAAWNMTSYGQQLATQARVIGSGPMMVW